MGLIEFIQQTAVAVTALSAKLVSLNQTLEVSMAFVDDFKAKIADMGKELDVIVQRLADGGATVAEEAQALADLGAFADRLKGVAEPPAPTP